MSRNIGAKPSDSITNISVMALQKIEDDLSRELDALKKEMDARKKEFANHTSEHIHTHHSH